MNWVNFANTAACFTLLFYLLPVANEAHRIRHKASLIGLILVIGMQMIDPLVEWIPDMAWPSAVLNVTLVALVSAWRRDIWWMVKGRLEVR